MRCQLKKKTDFRCAPIRGAHNREGHRSLPPPPSIGFGGPLRRPKTASLPPQKEPKMMMLPREPNSDLKSQFQSKKGPSLSLKGSHNGLRGPYTDLGGSLAKKWLKGIVATSVESEMSVLNLCSNIVTKVRSRLGDVTVDALCFLNCHYR